MSRFQRPSSSAALTAVALFFLAAELSGQQSDSIPQTFPPSNWSTEVRFGILTGLPLMALELEFFPLERLSIDAGFFPVPVGGYGGITLYPVYPILLQAQFGNVAWEFSEGLHDPALVPDYYYGWRGGVSLGRGDISFVSTLGIMAFVQHDHCIDCYFDEHGNIVRRLGTETKSLWSFELGARVWL